MPLERLLPLQTLDAIGEAWDSNEMDHADPNRAFVGDLLAEAELAGGLAGEMLEVGTGTALVCIELCQRCTDCRVMAVDASIERLEIARYNVEIAGLIDRIQLDHVDPEQLPHDSDRFAAVISQCSLHRFTRPPAVVEEAVRVASAGGLLFFRDWLRPADEAALEDQLQTHAGGRNPRQHEIFARALHAALTVEEVQTIVFQLGFDRAGVTSDGGGQWTWAARKPG